MQEKIETIRLKDFPIDEASLRYAEEISTQSGVGRVVLLPDAFTKRKYIGLNEKITIPSSSVITTEEEVLYPQFKSRGINCGMMVIALPISKKDLSEDFIEKISRAFTRTPAQYLTHRLRIPLLGDSHCLSKKELYSTLEEGAHALLSKYGGDPSELELMDFKGRYASVSLKKVKHLFNERWLKKRTVRMRHSFGRYFGGNHFLEIQEVGEDSPTLGISKGQIVVTAHTGCQGMNGLIRDDLFNANINQLEYTKTHKGEEMYDAFFAAQSILMNYGFAFRFTAYMILRTICNDYYSGKDKAHIILDKPHNFVSREEDEKGKSQLVYRHNSERMYPNEYALISGNYNSPSFIVSGGKNTGDIGNSIDHGIGALLDNDSSLSVKEDTEVTLLRYKKGIHFFENRRKEPLMQSGLGQQYIDFMTQKGYFNPVTKLNPLVNIKYS